MPSFDCTIFLRQFYCLHAHLLLRQRNMLDSQFRALLAEFQLMLSTLFAGFRRLSRCQMLTRDRWDLFIAYFVIYCNFLMGYLKICWYGWDRNLKYFHLPARNNSKGSETTKIYLQRVLNYQNNFQKDVKLRRIFKRVWNYEELSKGYESTPFNSY